MQISSYITTILRNLNKVPTAGMNLIYTKRILMVKKLLKIQLYILGSKLHQELEVSTKRFSISLTIYKVAYRYKLAFFWTSRFGCWFLKALSHSVTIFSNKHLNKWFSHTSMHKSHLRCFIVIHISILSSQIIWFSMSVVGIYNTHSEKASADSDVDDPQKRLWRTLIYFTHTLSYI